jgi:hypothetical protein
MSTMITVPTSENDTVRRGEPGDAPAQFLWQGRLHVVRTVLGHSTTGHIEEWQVWASAGRDATPRVFVLRFDWSEGRWTVFPQRPEDPHEIRSPEAARPVRSPGAVRPVRSPGAAPPVPTRLTGVPS